jgi:hypothetical protein
VPETDLREDADSARVLVEPMHGPEVELASFFGENEQERVEAVVG